MSKQSKQIPQNTFNKQLNIQTSATLKPKIDDVSTTQKPLQNLSNVPTRTQEDQVKRTQPRSPIRQTFEKKTLENKSSISNFDEKPIPKILQRGKSPQSNQTTRNINTKTQDQQQSEKQSIQQKQPIQFKSNEPDQLPINQSNFEKSQPNINKQQVPVQSKQQTKLQLQSNQLKSQNSQQQQQSLRPKTASTSSQLQLKQTIQQDQQLKSTKQDSLSKTNTQQTKSQLTLNKKQEIPNKQRQQPMLKGEQVVEEKLYQCPEGCGRSFNAKALEKHSKICKKVFQQKRKVFNSQKQRLIEVEENGQNRGGAMKKQIQKQPIKQVQKQQQVKNEKPKWKAQSEAFRAIIRQAKGKKLTKEEQVSLNGAMESAQDLVQCKFCNRKFNPEAAKKHIVFCETKAKQCGKSGMQKKKK
ncbi:unnamed protein product [Paramecium primaurelia]|uniref:C2HC/C3H-type domain-containing protein n=1 Tax=Paramecium primaurelia TaxID=5886 RepID=A0A8S1M847_PARPR|nr:unnamed protein product [Paramecium primaurelia]